MPSTPRMRNAPGSIWAWLLLALIGLGLAVVVATGAMDALFPPEAVSAEGRKIRDLYDIVFYVAAVIFFVVEGLIVWTVVRYRRRPGDDELPPQTHGNNLAEITWTIIPTLIVAFLFFISWQTLNDVETVSDRPDVTVNVTGSQFAWTFEYVDESGAPLFKQTVANGEGPPIGLPVGQRIQLRMHSVDVIHSFYVPQFLFKRDVNPDAEGRQNVFEFTIEEQYANQTLNGQCAELCGIGHRKMLFSIQAMAPTDYATWRQEQIDKAAATPAPSGSGTPVETTLELVAKDIAFDKKALEVPAGKPFAIKLTNSDATGVTHDVDIRDAAGQTIADQAVIDGGEETTYTFEALEAGTYTFICSIHPVPNMTGTLTVK